jgi:hypothetical protein
MEPATGSWIELRTELRIAQKEQQPVEKHHWTKLPASKPELSKDNPPMMEER